MRRFIKILKITGVVLAVLTLTLLGIKWMLDKELPVGKPGLKAEALAQKMLAAIENKNWQNTGAVAWSYSSRHDLLWDKKRHLAKVSWDSKEAFIDCETGKGISYVDGAQLNDATENDELCSKAHFIWANDSYWLNPISKIYDEGVTRAIVERPDGDALLVSYASGGFTPGDSYLWILDEKGLPKEWQMWVEILPINGLSSSWEEWTETKTGVMISTKHALGPIDLEITNLKMAKDLLDLTEGQDVFSVLLDL